MIHEVYRDLSPDFQFISLTSLHVSSKLGGSRLTPGCHTKSPYIETTTLELLSIYILLHFLHL